MIRLANLDGETSWANFAWTDFASRADRARTIVILPVFGLADHGIGGPLDVEEVIGTALLRRVPEVVKSTPLCVLPPLRFGLAPYPATFFGIDPETAHDLVHEIAAGVKAAGFAKLVFFNTSPWNAELIDAASRDVRFAFGLDSFVINLRGLGLDLHPTSASRGQCQAIAARLLGAAPKSAERAAEISDADFRPGHFRQPSEVVFDFSLNGFKLLADATARLARLLADIGDWQARREAVPAAPPPAARQRAESSAAPTTIAAPSPGEIWPPFRPRYLAALPRTELEALPDKQHALVILPTAAIEQHGPHLPVGVDAFLGQAALEALMPKLSPGQPVWIAPPITYGKSTEHVGFPGTISISAKTLRRLLLAIAAQLRALGFTRLAVLNTHGGNSAVLTYTLREIQSTYGLRAGLLSGHYRPEQSPQEAAYGFHAGEFETSLMLACAPERVRMDQAVCEYPARLDDPGDVRPENAPAIFSWLSRDVSDSGVMGDATIATAEKGRHWLDTGSTALAGRIESLLRAEG